MAGGFERFTGRAARDDAPDITILEAEVPVPRVPPFIARQLAAGSIIGLGIAGCDVVAVSFDGSSGLVVVLVSGGDGTSRDYRVRARQEGHPDRTVLVTPGHELRLTVMGDVPVELTLLLPSGCRATTPNPQIVVPAASPDIRASFDVRCGEEMIGEGDAWTTT
jgi:hypothetical protein